MQSEADAIARPIENRDDVIAALAGHAASSISAGWSCLSLGGVSTTTTTTTSTLPQQVSFYIAHCRTHKSQDFNVLT